MFEDHNHGEETSINPQLVLRIRIKTKKAAWSDLEVSNQSHQSYSDRVTKVVTMLDGSSNMVKVGIRKALECLKSLSVIRNHSDLGHLISSWSKTHTFVVPWGEFTPTLEDVVVITRLRIFGDQMLWRSFWREKTRKY